MINKKRNSINDKAAQDIRNTQNVIEILSKLDQSMNSTDNYLSVKTVDQTGKETLTQIPTIGYFKQQLDQIKRTLEILSGVGGNPVNLQIADNEFKRILVADLNIEPRPIANLSPISTFKSDPNWIFDSFLNPKISVEIDLTDKINNITKTIESKRFIVEFDKLITIDNNGVQVISLTTDGAIRQQEFIDNYSGKSNIDIVSFVAWLDSPGLVNQLDDTLLDQDYFKIEPNRLKYKGNFTVLNTDTDIINKKLWYILDTLTYYNIEDVLNPPTPVDLKVGDLVNVNPNQAGVTSSTVYKVVEISTMTSEFRVRFETVYGQEPIPVRLNALSYYSDTISKRTVKVSVGFNEYCVIFIRAVDDSSNLIGQEWSPGVGFYTNELRLDTENGLPFSDYYIKKVYDYGVIIEDLVQKKTPNYYGIVPVKPVLTDTNFAVVQTNKHLTDSVDAEKIRDLHNNKNSLASEIEQLQAAIDKQNRIIQTTVFESVTDRKRAENELASLTTKLNTKTSTKVTTIKNILASVKNINKIAPVYKLRGFWPIPEAAISNKTEPQEVVQFEVWYRKLSLSGTENPVSTFTNILNNVAQSSDINTTVNKSMTVPKTINAAFSNWTKYKTDSRKRIQDPISGDWKWVIEDVSDANTPNINQLEIDIFPGEKIEIKIKSLSEVGWPETPIESEFSDLLTKEFPANLNNVLADDQFILKEASADDLKVQFQNDLEARGLGLHLDSSVKIQDVYYPHPMNVILSGFKDNSGNVINGYEYLLMLTNRITSLEETLSRAKGVLEVYLVRNGNKVRLFSGNSLKYSINLEDYLIPTKVGLIDYPQDFGARTYKNDLTLIQDYQILVVNASTSSDLGLLSTRGYGKPLGLNPTDFAYDGKNQQQGLSSTRGIQPLWLQSNGSFLENNITGNNALNVLNEAPVFASQQNNQWIWAQVKDSSGNYIYTSDLNQPQNNLWDKDTIGLNGFGASIIHNSLLDKTHNLGLLAGPTQNQLPSISPILDITDNVNWEINERYDRTHITSGINAAFSVTTVAGNSITVVSIDVAGTGYKKLTTYYLTILDTVGIGGEFGYGAIITATTNSSGVFTATNIINGGYGYTNGSPSSTDILVTVIDTITNGGFATSVNPVINSFSDITDTSTQLIKIIKPGDTNALTIPINIYAKGYTGSAITSPLLGSKDKFNDLQSPSGDLPTVNLLLTNNCYDDSITHKLKIMINDNIYQTNILNPKINAGDYVVFNGFTDTSLLTANNVLLKVNSIYVNSSTGTCYIIVDFNTTGLLPTLESTLVLQQIHKAITNNGNTTSGPDLTCYNVIGSSKYINSYIKLSNSSLSPAPIMHNKKIRFYLEDENNIRPFEFQINFEIIQYKRFILQNAGVQTAVK